VINVTGTIELIERLVACGICVLFLSTNQVFDGTRAHVPAAAPLWEFADIEGDGVGGVPRA
jgi:dTDP-4-dehydrorhamnose reductase